MIKNWEYNDLGGKRDYVKNYIKNNNLKSIDVGASANFWSYPECKYAADSVELSIDGVKFFNINLEDKNSWDELLSFVETNGKFDFSICSHTLEDVFNPLDLIYFLEQISNSGFISIPSKYDEFSFLYENKYRGNAHHKQFFDFINDELTIFPKFPFIEKDNRSDEIIKNMKGRELTFFWDTKIPVKIFGHGIPYKSDNELIHNFYKQLINYGTTVAGLTDTKNSIKQMMLPEINNVEIDKKIAVITFLYDLSEHFNPTFERKLLNDIDKNDYYCLRFCSIKENILDESYYFKFTYYRIYKFYEFIKNEILNKYDYFVLLDATDVGYVGGIHRIPEIMENYKTNVLFGAEKNLWPNTEVSHLYETKGVESDFKFLNAGVHCAKPLDYLNILDRIIIRDNKWLCDQGNWQIEYLTGDGVEIDTECLLVLNTFNTKTNISIERMEVNFEKTPPIFVHDNGGYNEETTKLLEFFV
jgi:hypothetical protein